MAKGTLWCLQTVVRWGRILRIQRIQTCPYCSQTRSFPPILVTACVRYNTTQARQAMHTEAAKTAARAAERMMREGDGSKARNWS